MNATNDAVQRAFESMVIEARQTNCRAPTVSAVAARAGMSRSSIYRFHPEIVAQIQAGNGTRDARKRDQLRVKAELLTSQLKAERQLVRALARACAELAAEKDALKEILEDERMSTRLRIQHLEQQLQGKRNVRVLRSR